MGSLCSNNTSTTTQNQTSSSTPAGLSQLSEIWDKVKSAASTPYTAYTGQLTADLSDTQKAGIANISGAQGTAQPYYDEASGYARTGASAIDPSAIQRYQNPYQQSVVDATQAQFNQQNAVQQNQLRGNAAAKGALGGNRVGIMEAALAGNQQRAQNPVIANLYSSGYDKSLAAAQGDRTAAQQGASTFGQLGTAAQNAAISGGQAQLAAGQTEQTTDQAKLTADYGQFQQEQAFPYAQASYLASTGTPVVSSMGGTTTGSGTGTTETSTNPWSQVLGLGLTAAGAFSKSDKDVKADRRQIGVTFDGQPIWRFRYKGDPTMRIGLMAQDVEKVHPEAVGELNGVKMVDYRAATEDAAGREYADGGVVSFIDVPTYIPKVGAVRGSSSPYSSAPSLNMNLSGGKQQSESGFNPSASQLKSAGSGLSSLYGSMFPSEGGNYALNASGGGFTTPSGFLGGGVKRGGRINGDRHRRFHETIHAIRQTLRRGGAVRGYADGGEVAFGDRYGAAYDLSPSEYVDRGFGETRDAIDAGQFDPQGANAPGPQAFVAPQAAPTPFPMARPAEAPTGPMTNTAGLPPIMTRGPEMPTDAMAYTAPPAPPQGPMAAPPPMQASPLSAAPAGLPPQTMGGFNPFELSDDARLGLMSAGLGMMASRSGNVLTAIGEGGLSGMKTYTESRANRAKIDQEARKLAQKASEFAQTLGQGDRRLAEQTRHNRATEQRGEAALERGKFIYLGPSPDGKGSVFLNQVDGSTEERPIQIASKKKEKPLPQPVFKELSAAGEGYHEFNKLSGNFQPAYGGFVLERAGDAANWTAQRLGLGNKDGADWWADYQSQKNAMRKSLFGSALTKTEKSEFDKAAINPGMTADAINKNLKRQKDAALRAAQKIAATRIALGDSPDVIEAAMGLKLPDIGVAPKGAASTPKKGDRKQFTSKTGALVWGVHDGTSWIPE